MIDYIENDMNKGIKIDFSLIRKDFNKLKIPNYVYNPFAYQKIESGKTYMNLGERSTGKTTQWLLIGLLMHERYGTIIHYIRQSKDMLALKIMDELFTTIVKFGYIEKITKGRWNSVSYYANKWRYVNVDENGTIIEKCETHFMYTMSLDNDLFYKSSYTCSVSDLVIFDEFLGKMYRDDFFYFYDILKTLLRDRQSAVVVFIANTIQKYSPWFAEFGIQNEISKLKPSQTILFTSPQGSELSITWVENINPVRNLVNKLYFGWDSPKLLAITGGGWSSERYQHTPPRDVVSRETILNNIYIMHYDSIVALDVVDTERFGLCVFCHKAYKIYDDSIIYTRFDCVDYQKKVDDKNALYLYEYGKGTKLDILLWCELRDSNRWFYADAETFDIVDAYISVKNPNRI